MLQLRSLGSGDMAILKGWLHTPHVARWYHDPEAWLAEAEQSSGEYRWISHFIAELDGRPVGFCQLYPCRCSGEDWGGYPVSQGTYSIDYLIGEPGLLGKGYGRAMALRLIERVRACGDATDIVVMPEKENHASRATLLSCGFSYIPEQGVFTLPLDGGEKDGK